MLTDNVSGYIDYFRQLAVSHAELRHDPASETGDCLPGAQRFTKISVEEVLKALRSKIGFPCMPLELYQTETNSDIVYEVRQRPRGAFMIIDHPENDTHGAELQCYVNAERIMYQMLQQVWQDHYGAGVNRCATPFKDFFFDKLSITPVGPIFNKEFGYRIEFDFEFQNSINIAKAPEDGVFV